MPDRGRLLRSLLTADVLLRLAAVVLAGLIVVRSLLAGAAGVWSMVLVLAAAAALWAAVRLAARVRVVLTEATADAPSLPSFIADRPRSRLAAVLALLVLVVHAVLFVRSLRNLTRQDPGFRQEGVLVAALDLRRVNVPAERRRALYREILDRLASLPGVESAASAAIVPVSGSGWNDSIVSDGRGGRKPRALANVSVDGERVRATLPPASWNVLRLKR